MTPREDIRIIRGFALHPERGRIHSTAVTRDANKYTLKKAKDRIKSDLLWQGGKRVYFGRVVTLQDSHHGLDYLHWG